jgi:A/G-specific adenine glycosylase
LFHLFHRFSSRIIRWYEQHKRDLPWRDTKDVYLIWLSEIILQQTRVKQGTPYYNRFVNQFPTIIDLANASIDDVLKLWQGLGYYSRARNLHKTAVLIKQNFNGVFPDKYSDIRALKGVGEYTASAIASFAYNKPYPVVDGNVMRVISRLFGIYLPINSKEGKNKIYEIANILIDKKYPSAFNQAIMEFGAIQCIPIKPICSSCIFKTNCYSFINDCVNNLPVKFKKNKRKERFFNYLVIHYNNNNKDFFYLKKRRADDIWKGLYDFPLIETNEIFDYNRLIKDKECGKIFGNTAYEYKEVSKLYKHQLTHQKIISQFFSFCISKKLVSIQSDSFVLIEMKDFKKYAVPKLIDIYYLDRIKKPQV